MRGLGKRTSRGTVPLSEKKVEVDAHNSVLFWCTYKESTKHLLELNSTRDISNF